MSKRTAIIVGAGLGGIAAAARLARQGYEVTVFEKNGIPGGRCGQITCDGHRFDTGPTLFLMPEVFEETFSALGEQMSDWLDLRRVDPTYRIRFGDGLEMDLTANINHMQAQLEKIEPGSFTGFLQYLNEGHLHYKISLEKFVGRNFRNIFEYFSLGNLPLLFQLKALVKHYDNIGRYFKSPHLKAAFTFQNMYLGLSPYDAPATYSLLQYTELADGVWFPIGGMYAVIDSFVKIAEGLGVKFRYNAPVESIEVSGSRASGVRLLSGESYSADIIIANADLPYVYKKLLPHDQRRNGWDKKKYTCSSITFYWGVNKPYPQLGMHNVFLAGDYRASFDRIFNDFTLPDEPSFYVHAPSRIDPAAAPQGKETLMVLVPVGHLSENGQEDVQEMVKRARQNVFTRLQEIGITDLEENINFETVYSQQEWQNMYNLDRGAAFGLSHNFWQVGYLRPQNRHSRYKNLYFVGASTHPGTGLPIVLLSARLVAERIAEEMN
jgi:phytoene desaturase